jgi:hypothetical protein
LLKAHATAPAASRAGLDAGARLATAATAAAAGVGALVAELLAGAERGFFEAHRQRHAQVAAIAAAEAEGAQDVAEDLVEAAEVHDVAGAAAPAATAGSKRRRPVAVVRAALVGVRQDLVSEVDLGETVLRRGIVGIFVGVVLRGQPPKGSFDIRVAGVTADTEHFIGIAHLRKPPHWVWRNGFSLEETP